jgi:dinuclear metal center YbgI/SA1388 family protein
MFIKELELHLNKLFNVENFKDFSANGIHVENRGDINKIALGTTCSMEFIKKSIEWGADLLIVHHGMFWGSNAQIKDFIYKRVKLLMDHNVGLLAYHLPLDCHEELGNGKQLGKVIGLENMQSFAKDKGGFLGVTGDFSETRGKLIEIIKNKICEPEKLFLFGPDEIDKIAIVTGQGQSFFSQAAEMGIKTFITGEYSGSTPYYSMEENLNFIALGHEISELFGIKALGEYLKNSFNFETKVIRFKYFA